MPNYSPARKVFSSTNKLLEEIPFGECFQAYQTAKNEITADLQADIDAEYEEEIREKEANYTATHEAPYEGNFSDSTPKRAVVIDAMTLSRHTTARMKVDFIAKYGIPLHINWMMEKALTLIGNMPVKRNANGLISGTRFKYDNFTNEWLRGLYMFLMINTKSAYLKAQYRAPHKQYGALVPFIMYAVKCVQNIKYSEWDSEEIDQVVHSDLAEAMVFEPEDYSKEQLLQFRVGGLTVKSGPEKGKQNPATSTYKLNNLEDNVEWNQVPTLVQHMLTQTWMCHPENRTNYMILDPVKWDRMPPSLVTREVLIEVEPVNTKKKVVLSADLPWN